MTTNETNAQIIPLDFFGEPTGQFEVRVPSDNKFGYEVVGTADSPEAAAELAAEATAQES